MEVHLQLYSVLREKLPPEAKRRAVMQLNENASLADLLEELNITWDIETGVPTKANWKN